MGFVRVGSGCVQQERTGKKPRVPGDTTIHEWVATPMRTRVTLKYIAALLLFGSNGIVASRISLASCEIVLTRTLISSLFLMLVFHSSRPEMRFWKDRRHFLYLTISGAAMGASWVSLFEAYARIGVSLATLAYYCGPVLVMLVSPIVFRERIVAASLLGFLAVVSEPPSFWGVRRLRNRRVSGDHGA
jgi:drug/metabolite transporter (DMT)-like permease